MRFGVRSSNHSIPFLLAFPPEGEGGRGGGGATVCDVQICTYPRVSACTCVRVYVYVTCMRMRVYSLGWYL